MNREELEQIIDGLARQRPVFHNEADFQHALAWEIHRHFPDSAIRLEYRPGSPDSRIYVDIWCRMGERRIAIELKYKTSRIETELEGERFRLSDHVAQDCGRYDFLKDVQRLESIVEAESNVEGYAVFLTNDPSYWAEDASGGRAADSAFRLPEGRELTGTLRWGDSAGPGTIRGREAPIRLNGRYAVSWKPYSEIDNGNRGTFRYLLIPVLPVESDPSRLLRRALQELANRRPVLRSQHDLRDELVRQLGGYGRVSVNRELGDGWKADLWLDDFQTAIEVRYKTAKMSADLDGERYELKKQSAYDISRYDFVCDIAKLERIAESRPGSRGFAILITNDDLYWRPPVRIDSADAAFRLHDGRILEGALDWGEQAGQGTKMNALDRSQPLTLRGTYTLRWESYASLENTPNGEFRMLLVEVK